MSDFELIRVIGRGSYAKVLLVRLKKNEQVFAMKVVKKELVHDDEVRLQQARHERRSYQCPGCQTLGHGCV
uniref:non-specific serine/threonine protein kinase n=1 Tax=Oryzias latipes TaxID=8090 RepID=A0A3P9MQK5_ORYLA